MGGDQEADRKGMSSEISRNQEDGLIKREINLIESY